jgi:hypothetical protein
MYDFSSFEEALHWLLDALDGPGSVFLLTLADGTHYFKTPIPSSNFGNNDIPAYYIKGGVLLLNSESGDKTQCIIKYPDNFVVSGSTSPFSNFIFRTSSMNIGLSNITFDFSNADKDVTGAYTLFRSSHTYLSVYNVDIIGGTEKTNNFLQGDTAVRIYSHGDNTFKNLYIPVVILGGGNTFVASSILFDNCYYPYAPTVMKGVDFTLDRSKIINPPNSVGFPPDNSISGYNMKFNLSSNKPIILSGWEGDTASRPTLGSEPVGQPYFDTDLEQPVWWNGTEWTSSNSLTPVSGPGIIKTVASDTSTNPENFDFLDINEAFLWYSTKVRKELGNVRITLELDAGNHLVKYDSRNNTGHPMWSDAYLDIIGCYFILKGAGKDQTFVGIDKNHKLDGASFITGFDAYIEVNNFTFDPYLNCVDDSEKSSLSTKIFSIHTYSRVKAQELKISGIGFSHFQTSVNGYTSISSTCDLDGHYYKNSALTKAGYLIFNINNSFCFLDGKATMKNFDNLILVSSHSSMDVYRKQPLDSSVGNYISPSSASTKFNEVGADGSIIYDRDIKFATDINWQGDTASRPDTTGMGAIGRSYFDTDLGQPVWWDGTNWVDALGNDPSTVYVVE